MNQDPNITVNCFPVLANIGFPIFSNALFVRRGSDDDYIYDGISSSIDIRSSSPTLSPTVIPSVSILSSYGVIRTSTVGGSEGDPFDDQHEQWEYGKIVKIEVYSSSDFYVNHIGITYKNGQYFSRGLKEGNQHNIINLGEDQYITKVSGRYGVYINQITFRTNDGNEYGPYGDSSGSSFEFDFDGRVLLYIFGRSGWYIDQLGFAHILL